MLFAAEVFVHFLDITGGTQRIISVAFVNVIGRGTVLIRGKPWVRRECRILGNDIVVEDLNLDVFLPIVGVDVDIRASDPL